MHDPTIYKAIVSIVDQHDLIKTKMVSSNQNK